MRHVAHVRLQINLSHSTSQTLPFENLNQVRFDSLTLWGVWQHGLGGLRGAEWPKNTYWLCAVGRQQQKQQQQRIAADLQYCTHLGIPQFCQ